MTFELSVRILLQLAVMLIVCRAMCWVAVHRQSDGTRLKAAA
ncbi:MAG: hypothetical protein ABIS43_03305 [Opitutus sp.]